MPPTAPLAKIYAANWPPLDGFQLIETLDNPEGQMMGRELNADWAEPRTSFLGAGPFVRLADGPRTRDRAEIRGMKIVARLEQGRNENEFGHLILLALADAGRARNRFSGPLQKIGGTRCRQDDRAA